MFRTRAYLTNTYLGCFDLAVTAACFIALEKVRDPRSLFARETLSSMGVVLALWLCLSLYFGLYRSRRMDSPLADLIILFKVGFGSWLIIEAVSSFLPALAPSPSFPLRFAAASFLVLSVARSVLRAFVRELRRRGRDVKHLVLVTSHELGQRLTRKIEERAHYGYRIINRLEYPGPGEGNDRQLFEAFHDYVRSVRIDDVIVGLPASANSLSARLVAECESEGISVRIVPDLFPLIQSD